MKLYYKVFSTTLGTLTAGVLMVAVFGVFIEDFAENGSTQCSILLIVGAVFGFVTYFYGKMAWMRIRGIPVIKLAEQNVIIKDALKKEVSIPYNSIIGIRTTERGFGIVYKNGEKKKTKSVGYNFLNADSSDIFDLLNDLEQKNNDANKS